MCRGFWDLCCVSFCVLGQFMWLVYQNPSGLLHWLLDTANEVCGPSRSLTNIALDRTLAQGTASCLTHWGRVSHGCVSKLTTTGSDNGLSPGRRQAIIWTNAGILLMVPLGTKLSEILIEIHTFSFKKMHLKMSSAKWRSFCLGLNVLTAPSPYMKHLTLRQCGSLAFTTISQVLKLLFCIMSLEIMLLTLLSHLQRFNVITFYGINSATVFTITLSHLLITLTALSSWGILSTISPSLFGKVQPINS